MGNALLDNLEQRNFYVLNSMDDRVRIVGVNGKTIFMNNSLIDAKSKSDQLQLYLKENIPLNLSSENETIRHTTMVEEKLISGKYYSIKTSPILVKGEYQGTVEVFRDITRETTMKIDLFNTNRNMLDDIRFVRKVQTSILPKNNIYGNIELNGIYIPSSNVSGDLYDIIKLSRNKYAFYIADVMGHGVKASIMTMFIKVTMHAIFDKHPYYSPSQALLKLREKFSDLDIDSSQYFTSWLGIFDLNENIFTFSNAGHNCPPMVYKNKIKQVDYLFANGRMISNIIEPDIYNEVSIVLEDNDKIMFFTDGVIESKNEEKEEYGLENLKKKFEEKQDLDYIYEDIKEFSCGEQEDDVTIVLISYKEKE